MPLDIGVGLILGVYLSTISPITYGLCLLIGVFSALIPDLDYVWGFIRSRTLPDTRHRDLLHYPLILTPVVGLAGLLVSPEVSLILILGVLLHFIHDSFGVGFGLKWLYPFKKNSYLFFFQTSTPNNKNMPKKLMYSWDDKERAEMIRKYGYPDWIRHVYFRLHPFGIFEYSILFVGMTLAILGQ